MLFNQKLRVGLMSGLAGLALAAAGCSSTRAVSRTADASAPASATAASGSASPQSLAAAPQASGDASPPGSPQASPPEGSTPGSSGASSQGAPSAQAEPQTLTRDALNPGAPLRYTVKRGDTLWGISSLFLRDPWLWPEIWYDNPQVHNPHRIYPGDVLVLGYGADGRPHIYVERGGAARVSGGGTGADASVDADTEEGVVRLEPSLRSSALGAAIPAIPYSAIGAFLSRPAILSTSDVDNAPHVLAFRNEHQVAGAGEDAYVRGLNAPVGARFLVMHIGEKLRDPESGRTLGYQGIYTATAVVARAGDPAKVTLIDPERETLRGDCLIADTSGNPLTFEPQAPSVQVRGRIISVIDDVHAVGQYDIVVINRGTGQGVKPGTVLAVDQQGEVVADRGAAAYDMWGRPDTLARRVQLPNERAGTLLVFKSYDDMSYALVVGASETMQTADIVRNP